jgi:hypothetical protein
MGLIYANIEDRQLGLAVRLPGTGWYRWAQGGFSAPFDAALHVLPCTPDKDRPRIQEATIPAEALMPGAYLIEGLITPGGFVESTTTSSLYSYAGGMPGCGLVVRQF